MKTKKHFLIYFVGIFLLFSIIGLAVLQAGWMDVAAKANKERIYRNMINQTSHAIGKMWRELEIMVSVLSIHPKDYTDRNWNSFYSNIKYLKNDTELFEYLREIYLLPLDKEDIAYHYDKTTEQFEVVDYPEDILNLGKNEKNDRIFFPFTFDPEYYFLPVSTNPLDWDRGPEELKKPQALLAIDIAMNEFYADILPVYMQDHLIGYPVRLKNEEKIYFQSPELESNTKRTPDFIFPLPFTSWIQANKHRPGFHGDVFYQPEYQSEISPYQLKEPRQMVLQGQEAFIFQDNLTEKNNKKNNLILEVFYPALPFEEAINRQTMSNRVVSIGVLAVLFFSLIFLYRLYSRLMNVRSREQEFVATISHELRTPLAVITSTSDNLVHGIVNETERIAKYGSVINSQAKRLSHMVENILFYAGLEGAHQYQLNNQSIFDLSNLAGKIIKIYQNLNTSTTIEMDSFPELISIKSDPMAISLIIENLLINAIRHGTTSETGKIRIFLRQQLPKGVNIIIEDHGPGISPKYQKKIFQAFIRGENAVKKQIPGNGLGLHLVKRICELHGGNIRLESPYNDFRGRQCRGSRFIIYLPVEVIDGK